MACTFKVAPRHQSEPLHPQKCLHGSCLCGRQQTAVGDPGSVRAPKPSVPNPPNPRVSLRLDNDGWRSKTCKHPQTPNLKPQSANNPNHSTQTSNPRVAYVGDSEGRLEILDMRAHRTIVSKGRSLHSKRINTIHIEPLSEQLLATRASDTVVRDD